MIPMPEGHKPVQYVQCVNHIYKLNHLHATNPHTHYFLPAAFFLCIHQKYTCFYSEAFLCVMEWFYCKMQNKTSINYNISNQVVQTELI